MSKSITELVKLAHNNAVAKGFYDCNECNNGKVYIEDFSVTCGNCKGTGKALKNTGELLMLIVSELGESLEAHRIGKFNNFKPYFDWYSYLTRISDEETFIAEFEAEIKNCFEDELADVAIRLFDLCGYMNIDLEKHIELKMRYNATREYKHGKRY